MSTLDKIAGKHCRQCRKYDVTLKISLEHSLRVAKPLMLTSLKLSEKATNSFNRFLLKKLHNFSIVNLAGAKH